MLFLLASNEILCMNEEGNDETEELEVYQSFYLTLMSTFLALYLRHRDIDDALIESKHLLPLLVALHCFY